MLAIYNFDTYIIIQKQLDNANEDNINGTGEAEATGTKAADKTPAVSNASIHNNYL